VEFPKKLYVQINEQGVWAFHTPTEAIEGDGPTEVAIYELVSSKVLGKVVVDIAPDAEAHK